MGSALTFKLLSSAILYRVQSSQVRISLLLEDFVESTCCRCAWELLRCGSELIHRKASAIEF